MDYNNFEEMLSKANLNKKEFAKCVEMNYTSVTNWNTSNKIPSWVKSWLENYIKSKSYESVKDKIFEIEGVK